MKNLRIMMGCGAMLFVSACGGSETSGGPSFSTMSATGNQLLAQYGSAPATDVNDMPQAGSATYKGVAAYSSEFSDPADIAQYADTLSELELNANFATAEMTGRAYNFKNVDPTYTIDGQVNVNGTITGNTFDAAVSGTTQESVPGASATVTYDGSVQGEFVGSGAEAVRGDGFATASSPGFEDVPIWILWGAAR